MHGVDAQLFQKLLPGGYEFRRLQFLVRHYLVDPLHVEVELHLNEGEVRRLMLGQQDWASLGRDAWLMSDTGAESASVRFAL
jgi:predicted component of type VI protein secretion system